MPAPVIRRIQSHEGARYRDIRLRALADAPTAFGTTVAEATVRPSTWWDARVKATAHGDTAALFVAEIGDYWCGLVGGELPAGSSTLEVISMWVEPTSRRAGVAQALLNAVVRWAQEHGATEAELWVTDANTAAAALYRHCGFALTGASEPHPSQPGLQEVCMRRAL